MNIVSTARAAVIASAIIMTAGFGAQAKSNALDVANTAAASTAVQSTSQKMTRDSDSLLRGQFSNTGLYGMKNTRLDRDEQIVRQAANIYVTPHSANGGTSR